MRASSAGTSGQDRQVSDWSEMATLPVAQPGGMSMLPHRHWRRGKASASRSLFSEKRCRSAGMTEPASAAVWKIDARRRLLRQDGSSEQRHRPALGGPAYRARAI